MKIIGVQMAVLTCLAQLVVAFPTPGDTVTGFVFEDVKIWVDGAGHTKSETTIFSTSYEHASKTKSTSVSGTSTSAIFLQSQAPVSVTSPAAQSASTAAVQSTASIGSNSVVTISTSAAPPTSIPTELPSPSTQSAAVSTSPSSFPGIGFQSAISYSPYTSSGDCKTAQQVAEDLAQLGNYSVIRLYGTDCNQIANALAAIASRPSQQLFAGIFDVSQATTEGQSLISQVAGAWHRINTVSVGNEAVTDGMTSVAALAATVSSTRAQLRAAGFQGPVVTVDTMVVMQASPQLCQVSDFCAINCHAYFDGGVTAQQAGAFVQQWVAKVQQAVGPGKQVIVTESGWPSQGSTNGEAVASEQNQQAAVSSLKAAFSKNLVLYSAYNNNWQANSASTFGTEHYWGIMGNAPCGA